MHGMIYIHTIIILLHLHHRMILGELICDLESACDGIKEITTCTVTEDQPKSIQDIPYVYSAGTRVAEPRCQELHSTFSSNKETNFVIKWKPPRSSYLQGFSIQIGDSLHRTRFRQYHMDLRTDQKCLKYKMQSWTFEFRCNYTGYSSRLDIILTSLPRLYNEQGSTENLMSLIIPIRGTNQRTSFYGNTSCGLTDDDYLYKMEFEKECETELSAETKVSSETENHLPYTLGLVCTAFIVVIVIVTFLVIKKKVGFIMHVFSTNTGFLESNKHMCQNDGNASTQSSLKIRDEESLNNSECQWNTSRSQHTIPENTEINKTLHNELLRPSGSLTSISTQDIEYSMIELNFGSPLNNLNK